MLDTQNEHVTWLCPSQSVSYVFAVANGTLHQLWFEMTASKMKSFFDPKSDMPRVLWNLISEYAASVSELVQLQICDNNDEQDHVVASNIALLPCGFLLIMTLSSVLSILDPINMTIVETIDTIASESSNVSFYDYCPQGMCIDMNQRYVYISRLRPSIIRIRLSSRYFRSNIN